MAVTEKVLSTLVNGIDSSVSNEAKRRLEDSIRNVSSELDSAKYNRTSNALFNTGNKTSTRFGNGNGTVGDTEVYTNLSEMINGSSKDIGGFGTLLDSLYAKNRKYFSIIKDYEMMPILIPQINRVLMFMVNECLSPDIQNSSTFKIKYIGSSDEHYLQDECDSIKKEMKLDSLLREVYTNRYKLGREYYNVVDYNATFDHMLQMIKVKGLNESTAAMSDLDFLNAQYSSLTETIDSCGASLTVSVIADNTGKPGSTNTKADKETFIDEAQVNLSFSGLNIEIRRSPLAEMIEDAHGELMCEAYSRFKVSNLTKRMITTGSLNEAIVDTSKLYSLVTELKKKKLQRCTIERFDPAKVFKLKIGGKTIGYFHVTDINENMGVMVNFAQSLKDQLLKSRATNLSAATANAEEVISKELSERIIKAFDPNIGINRVEDIDLLHDFIRNNEIYKGNKRITFYYEDEIFDMSRADDSILTNAVFFTKLYATLMMNNISTKVLRGRGRQIHTVRLGVSPSVQRYIENAMASLTMPENNLGTLHGSFEQILNPFNSASDIIIPTEDDSQKFIETDYIPGQDVDMNDDFLKTLLNAIISSFGLDAAVIDATNGNLQFARTLTMESLQISNNIKNEQQDVHDAWEAMVLRVLEIMGTKELKQAINDGKVKVEFYEPKSLIVQNMLDDLNNTKNLIDAIADIIPRFNEEGTEMQRAMYVYNVVKDMANLDWAKFEDYLPEVDVNAVGDQIEAKIREEVRKAIEMIQDQQFGDHNNDGIVTGEDEDYKEHKDDEFGGYEPESGPVEGSSAAEEEAPAEEPTEEESGEDELSPEEEDLMNEPDDFGDLEDLEI